MRDVYEREAERKSKRGYLLSQWEICVRYVSILLSLFFLIIFFAFLLCFCGWMEFALFASLSLSLYLISSSSLSLPGFLVSAYVVVSVCVLSL